MNLYYHALFDDERIAKNMVNAVHDNLTKFERYLTLAIKALREKKHVTAKWEKVENPTKLKIEPLSYQIVVETASVIEVFMDESYLELNVTNSIPFTPTEDGIRLDDNWIPLLPNQYDLISINSKRHLLRVKDASLYKGEKNAATRNGSIASISPFEIKNFIQNGQKHIIKGFNYDSKKGSYLLNIDGAVNEEEDIYINGLLIDQANWHISNISNDIFRNEKEEAIPIKIRKGNILYVPSSFPKPRKIFQGEMEVNFSTKPISVPNKISLDSEDIFIDRQQNSYYTLGNVKNLSENFIYKDSETGIELFKINKDKQQKKNQKGHLAIRLRDDEEEDETFSKSNVDYFFDQDIEMLEGKLNGRLVKLLVEKQMPDERILIIKGIDGRTLKEIEVPEILYIRVNTSQLEMQRKAIRKLKRMPLTEHRPLINLSKKKDMGRVWDSFVPETINDWKVLTDSNREGVEAQRRFVEKALATPDFALLEGPPGSGKTTTILELIVQLIQRGKRILLCGSTHVSIDNVLERLQENNLMDGIFPLRIGKQESVSEKIQSFTIDQYENNKFRDVLIESANLVCGTTFGILRHPLFDLNSDQPPVPKYDYLIIDESSKTTFQEFLIPAMFSKRWILVGDVKQLPPFNDREHVNAAINDNEKISYSLKQACLLIFQYIYEYRVRMPVCLVLPEDILKNIQRELAASEPKDIRKNVVIIDQTPSVSATFFVTITEMDIEENKPVLWSLLGSDVIFVNEKLYAKVKHLIPNHTIILRDDWENSSHHYQVNAFYANQPKMLHRALEFTFKSNRKREKLPIDFYVEQKKFLKEKTWASEYGWRLIRLFELENVENSTTKANLKKNINLLSPKTATPNNMKDIEIVGDIALPSILQALQDGVGKSRELSSSTTLNSGFNIEEKKNRFISLDYQHRMHPEISQFSRMNFYNNQALKDSSFTKNKREWAYPRYSNRNIWLDVNGKMRRSSNEIEVLTIIKELKEFIKWTNQNKNPNHEKGIWEVACLTFYNAQRKLMAQELKELTGQRNRLANFSVGNVEIKNYTVDKFQGQEADITYISMVRTERGIGFMDNPNRLNVALTRARFQRVIVGKYSYFLNNKQSELLRLLARDSTHFNNSWERKEK